MQRASSMLFNDGKADYTVYNLWLSQIYKQTMAWKWIVGP